jgi:DNA polymerase I-like protein with 3'-5' exonuclease and polymerase domains
MIFDTATLTPAGTGDPFNDYQLYNGLDTCLTLEVHEALTKHYGPGNLIYDFERAMQAPALEMMLRGLRVDLLARDAAVDYLRERQERLRSLLLRLGLAIWDRPIGPNTTQGEADLKRLFYDTLHMPVQYKLDKGQRKPSTNRDALEKLTAYPTVRPLVKAILTFRDLTKQISFLLSEVDSDGRIRTSYNVAGTETGRWSSSSNAFGTGTNLQNFPDKLRRVFIADPGRKFAYCDLEGAESWIVGLRSWAVSGDDSYLRTVASGDTHTTAARLIWPDLPWTGDLSQDRKIAEENFYRDFSRRDLSKRGGHGSNYLGQAATMARHLHLPVKLIENFQHAYFTAYPCIPRWHLWVAQQVQLNSHLVTMLGRGRHFFGRPRDDATLREAIAFEPQSVVGDLLNLGAYRVWRDGPSANVRLMAQLHDAILIDFPDGEDARIAPWVAERLAAPITVGGRTIVIPNDFSSGWNWGKFNDNPERGPVNPAGVRKYKGADPRRRPSMRGLDRVIPGFYEPD